MKLMNDRSILQFALLSLAMGGCYGPNWGATTGDTSTATAADTTAATTGAFTCDTAQGDPAIGHQVSNDPCDHGLRGFVWNEPNLELHCIDPWSGASVLLAVSGTDLYQPRLGVHDRTRDLVYIVADEGMGLSWLHSIDASSGEFLHSAPLDAPNASMSYDWYAGLYMRSDDELVGVTWNWGGPIPTEESHAEELRRIDPASGAVTLLGSIATMTGVDPFAHAYHPEQEAIYVVGNADNVGILRLFTIGATDASLLGSVILESRYDWIGGLHVRSDGRLFGLGYDAADQNGFRGFMKLFRVDADAGTATAVAEFPQFTGDLNRPRIAFDRTGDIIYLVTDDSKPHLLAIDTRCGFLLTEMEVDAVASGWLMALYVR